MKKQILTLGKALNKKEQKEINGGKRPHFNCVDSNTPCNGNQDCGYGQGCYLVSDDLPIVAICMCL